MKTNLLASLSLTAALLASNADALAQHAGDIGLALVDNRITTNLIDEGVFTPTRVFGAEFGELFPDFTDEPGFDNLPGTFTPGDSVGFNVLSALRIWDGASFGTIPEVRIEIGFGPQPPVVTPLTDEFTPGFTLAVGSNGEWHRHLEFTLLAPATDGIYLMEMELFGTQPGLAKSRSFWVVFNQNAEESEHDAAIQWAIDNLAHAPCGLADMGSAGGVDGHDGLLDNNDFIVFISRFFESDPAADLGSAGGFVGSDSAFDNNDFIAFISLFFDGCA